jgi:hypothetical protein
VVYEVEKETLLDRLSSAVMNMGGMPGVDVVPQKYGRRTIAGMNGDEIILRMKENAREELKFLWRFRGEKGSSARPRISIAMESSVEKDDQKVALWNQVLDSLRPAAQ